MISGYSANYSNFSNRSPEAFSGSLKKAENKKLKAEQQKSFKNISDDEILITSLKYADEKSKESFPSKLLKTISPLFIAVVPAFYGAMQKGNIVKQGDKIIKSNVLSTKVGSAVSTALVFAGANAILNGYDDFSSRIKNKSSHIKDFKKQHPVAAFIGNTAGKALVLAGAFVGICKGKNYLENKFQPTAKKLSKSIATAAEKIDSSKLASKVTLASDKFNEFASKHPKINNFIDKNNFLFPLLGWMVLTTGLECKIESDRKKVAADTAEKLINIRDKVKNS